MRAPFVALASLVIFGVIVMAPAPVWAATAQPASDPVFATLHWTDSVIQQGETVKATLYLDAPSGLDAVDFEISVGDPAVAKIVLIDSATLDANFVTVTPHSTDASYQVRALDLSAQIEASSVNVPLLTVTLFGVHAGKTHLAADVSSFLDDSQHNIAVKSTPGQVTVQGSVWPPTTPAPPGNSGLAPLGGAVGVPQDLDGDGLYEDVNGDGLFNAQDVVLFAAQFGSTIVQANAALFDFNGDGTVDFSDAFALADMLDAQLGLNHPVSPSGAEFELSDPSLTVGQASHLRLTLVNAPFGLGAYQVKLTIRYGSPFRFLSASSLSIPSGSAKVTVVDDQTLIISAADTQNVIGMAAKSVAVADVTILPSAVGDGQIDLQTVAYVDDLGQRQEVPAVSTKLSVTGAALPIIGDALHFPQDLDGDGTFEDVNGDSQFDMNDVILFSLNLQSAAVQGHRAAFDFNHDGVVDQKDVAALQAMLPRSS